MKILPKQIAILAMITLLTTCSNAYPTWDTALGTSGSRNKNGFYQKRVRIRPGEKKRRVYRIEQKKKQKEAAKSLKLNQNDDVCTCENMAATVIFTFCASTILWMFNATK